MDDQSPPEQTAVKQHQGFKPGQSGNPKGRPKGARNKLAESFLEDLLKDWQESGLVTLQALRASKPELYVKVVADLLPKQLDVKGEIEHEHTHRSVSATDAWIEGIIGERAKGASSEPLPH